MRNERLRALLLERGQTPDKLAEAVRVDAKTVERWITKGRIPYRRHRFEVATFLGVDESYIWPDALGRDEVAVVSESEVVAVWPHRSEVPRDVWGHLFSQAEREIGVLVYAGLFLSEDAGIQKILKDKAAAGATLLAIDNPELVAQLQEAHAEKAVAEAELARINAGTRSEIVAQRKAEIDRATADLTLSQQTYDRTRQLAADKLAPQSTLDQDTDALNTAQNRLDQANSAYQEAVHGFTP